MGMHSNEDTFNTLVLQELTDVFFKRESNIEYMLYHSIN